jgi:hypothetical protein
MVNPEDLLAAIKDTNSIGVRFETEKTRPYIMVENIEIEMKQIVFISASQTELGFVYRYQH